MLNKYSMSDNSNKVKPNPGFDMLLDIGKFPYVNNISHSCVKSFKLYFPEMPKPAFIADGLPTQIAVK